MNNIIVGVYDGHKEAILDIIKLKESGYNMENLSLLGKGGEEVINLEIPDENKLEVVTKTPVKISSIAASTLIGSTVGLLTGAGLFFIPGLGVLFGAGAIVGVIAGFDVGLLGGGIAALLTAHDIKEDYGKHCEAVVNSGKHILIAHGSEDEANAARKFLHTHGLHL